MLPFFRDLMKALTRQVSTGQYHQASHTLVHVGVALSEIRLQRRFKNIVLLGGVEQTLKAMQKVISLLGKKKTLYGEEWSLLQRWFLHHVSIRSRQYKSTCSFVKLLLICLSGVSHPQLASTWALHIARWHCKLEHFSTQSAIKYNIQFCQRAWRKRCKCRLQRLLAYIHLRVETQVSDTYLQCYTSRTTQDFIKQYQLIRF